MWCIGKKWLFWFCEGAALCVGAKENVPFVRLAKIVLKKCAVGKNKNTEALAVRLAVRSAVCRFNCPITFCCLATSFILCTGSSPKCEADFPGKSLNWLINNCLRGK